MFPQERSGSSVPPILNRMDTFEDPPTYNRTNKFTNVFQNLINAYGVANYREVRTENFSLLSLSAAAAAASFSRRSFGFF